jgi:hypothetical protein
MKDFYLKLHSYNLFADEGSYLKFHFCYLLLMKDLYFEVGVSFVFLGI